MIKKISTFIGSVEVVSNTGVSVKDIVTYMPTNASWNVTVAIILNTDPWVLYIWNITVFIVKCMHFSFIVKYHFISYSTHVFSV